MRNPCPARHRIRGRPGVWPPAWKLLPTSVTVGTRPLHRCVTSAGHRRTGRKRTRRQNCGSPFPLQSARPPHRRVPALAALSATDRAAVEGGSRRERSGEPDCGEWPAQQLCHRPDPVAVRAGPGASASIASLLIGPPLPTVIFAVDVSGRQHNHQAKIHRSLDDFGLIELLERTSLAWAWQQYYVLRTEPLALVFSRTETPRTGHGRRHPARRHGLRLPPVRGEHCRSPLGASLLPGTDAPAESLDIIVMEVCFPSRH